MKTTLRIYTNFHIYTFNFDTTETACKVARDFALHGTLYDFTNDPRILRVAVYDENGSVLKFYKNVAEGYTLYFFDNEQEMDEFTNAHETASFPLWLKDTEQWVIKLKDEL